MKNKALTELRRLYKDYLKAPKGANAIRQTRYRGARELCINIGLLSFQEIETMEVEQDDIYWRQV